MNTSIKDAAEMILVTLLIALWGQIAAGVAKENISVAIASGRPGGLYHPIAGAICRLVNENSPKHGITCTVEFGKGSVSNIEDMRDSQVTMAMTQADTHRDAFLGAGPFAEAGPFEEMRSMFALFVEQVTVIAREDKDIADFDDLKGKRLYLPVQGSGGRLLMQHLMDAKGWSPDAFVEIPEFKAPNLAQALCDGEFDAFSLTVGHPSPLIKYATTMCDAVLVPVAGPVVDALIMEEPLYAQSIIPRGMYRGNNRDVPGLGLVATLVATTEAEPEVIYQITKAFFEGLDRLREASSLFASLSAEDLIEVGLSAPVHAGAQRYFAEAGLQ